MGLSALLGVLVGAILALTGAGGGILAVPALVMGMNWSMQQAAPVALIAVAMSAAVGAWQGFRLGVVRYKAAALMAMAGLPLVYLGQMLAHWLPQAFLLLSFCAVMLVVAFRLYRQVQLESQAVFLAVAMANAKGGRIHPVSGKFIWSAPTTALLLLIGSLTGFTAGLLGVGGGFVMVPMLRKLTQLSMQSIVATSLMVIALVGAGSVASAIMHQVDIAWTAAAIFSGATVLGMLLGANWVKKISPAQVQVGFSIVLTLVSLGLAAKALMVVLE